MKPTRGEGRLEGFLARWRMRRALSVIQPSPGGAVLDIGCGSHPLFLLEAPFGVKVGLEQFPPAVVPEGIEILHHPLSGDARLPFSDAHFDCVVSLAFLEHLEPESLPSLLCEARRVLKPGGQFVATTPHAFADGVLRVLARVNLVSREEIEEHKSRFRRGRLRELFRGAGFAPEKIAISGFQLGMNILMTAEK